MAKKNPKHIKPKDLQELQSTVESLRKDGYIAISPGAGKPRKGRGATAASRGYSYERTSVLGVSSEHIGGARAKSGYNFFDAKSADPVSVPDNIGTPKLGYIPWGPRNNTPNQIYTTSSQLTYTSSALKYRADLIVGLGPALMYEYTTYVNGEIKVKQVPYEKGGDLIRARMRDIEQKKAEGAARSYYDEELDSLKADLKEWETSWYGSEGDPGIKAFLENNNLELHCQKCIQDNVRFDLYFPTYGLSRGRTGAWNPKIVEVDMLPCISTRYEQMDDRWRINHVYFYDQWREEPEASIDKNKLVAFPVLDAAHPLRDLRQHVENNRHKKIGQRPTWVCAPSVYPSNNKNYYPQPAWWSIYPSGAYAYAFSMLEDKAAARHNSTMFGKLIFINMEYVDRVCSQLGADTEDKQQEVKDRIIETVDSFLKDRKNNGKAAFLDSFLSDDQKSLWEAIKIVDVPTGDSDKFDEGDIETLANIIFLAFGVNPNLIGVSMSKSSNGGTFQRELHLLKQSQESVHQRNYLRFLQDICRFNGWDRHAKWIIRQQVLTTLDRNANGLESTASEQ